MRKILLLTILFFGCFFLYHFLISQFRFGNIHFDKVYAADAYDHEQREKMQRILSQTFTYIDRGRQSYVFISHDKQYVLKFFDASKLKPSFFQTSSRKRLRQKYQRLFEGYKVAFLLDQQNTGVMYAKLGTDPLLDGSVHCIDRFGIHHLIALQKVPFIIQKAALPTRVLVSQLLDQNEVEKVKGYFRKIVDMYVDEYKKGIYDRDQNFMHNTGFIEERPLRMDAGRLVFSEHFKYVNVCKGLEKVVVRRAEKWLQRHYPKYSQEIVADLQNTIQTIFSQN
jgi:hypothetical protein